MKKAPTIKELFPNLSDEELVETEQRMKDYARAILKLVDLEAKRRKKKDSE
tara:strand:+ start:948 stop:1100 length:153 start_codon:yes stop_codon:yes gene_type:complete